MSDRSIAPGRRREQSAWRSGLRARSRWLVAGLGCLAVAATIDLAGGALATAWARAFDAGLSSDDLPPVLVGWGALLVAAVVVVFAAALVLRNLGPVGRRDPDLPSAVRTPMFAVAGVAFVVGVVGLVLLSPVAAAAARAVDASEVALAGLWVRWAAQLTGSVGVLLLVAGVAEHLAMRHGLWRDLHMTRAQARDQSRSPGGR